MSTPTFSTDHDAQTATFWVTRDGVRIGRPLASQSAATNLRRQWERAA